VLIVMVTWKVPRTRRQENGSGATAVAGAAATVICGGGAGTAVASVTWRTTIS
jgi:hypothetical protein